MQVGAVVVAFGALAALALPGRATAPDRGIPHEGERDAARVETPAGAPAGTVETPIATM
jgi:hypothetical protein